MAKFFGKIGFVKTEETMIDGKGTGLHKPRATERFYTGDVIKNNRRIEYKNDGVNSDVNINNEISIISDDFANRNLGAIRYVEFMGSLWTVTDVTIEYPRLKLSIGGLYNGESAETSCCFV